MTRKNFTQLNNAERDALAKALNKLWDSGFIRDSAQLHDDNFYNGIHFGPAFLPWHRDFLNKIETALKGFNDQITLPYWDWTKADSRNIDVSPWKDFFGGRSNSGGKFDHWTYTRNNAPAVSLPTVSTIVRILGESSFRLFRSIEGPAHSAGHMWVGGTMAGGASPLDPLFYLHHCNVDRLWYVWQLNNPTAVQYSLDRLQGNDSVDEAFVPLNSPMIGGTRPAEMLDISHLDYSRDEALETAWLQSHSTPLKTHREPAIV